MRGLYDDVFHSHALLFMIFSLNFFNSGLFLSQ